MTLVRSTVVVFPQKQTHVKTLVQLSMPAKAAGTWLVTEQTPFHPVSHIWPDHPADRGMVKVNDVNHDITDCQVGAVELETKQLFVGHDIPVKRDTEGWVFVVVHHIDEAIELADGSEIELTVDAEHQQALSRGHSAGHLSSLAINKVLHHDFWRKEPTRCDELGYFDFHSYAQTKSIVSPDCSTDTYRLGKTLRKRGLNSADFVSQLDEIAEKINQQLEQWRVNGAAVVMRKEGEALTDSRYWQCDLGEEAGLIEIPCGGTHINSLTEYEQLTVSFELVSEQELIMVTSVVPAK